MVRQIIFVAAVAALLSPAVVAEGMDKVAEVDALLNATAAVKTAKVEAVDHKMEIMRDELETKLSALKNKTASIKTEAEEIVDKVMDIKFKLPADDKVAN